MNVESEVDEPLIDAVSASFVVFLYVNIERDECFDEIDVAAEIANGVEEV